MKRTIVLVLLALSVGCRKPPDPHTTGAPVPALGPVNPVVIVDSQDGGGNVLGVSSYPFVTTGTGTGGNTTVSCDAGNCQVAIVGPVVAQFDAATATVGVASTVNPPAIVILGTTLPIPASSLTLNDGGAVHVTQLVSQALGGAAAATCCLFQLASCPTVYDAGANTSAVPGPIECWPVPAGTSPGQAETNIGHWGNPGLGLTSASVCCSSKDNGDGGAGAGGVFTASSNSYNITGYGYAQ